MLFAIFLVGDELVLVGFDLPLPRVAHRRRAPLVGAERERRQQPLEIFALTRGTFHRRILWPRQRLEFVAAGAAAKVIYRHHTPGITTASTGWIMTHGGTPRK